MIKRLQISSITFGGILAVLAIAPAGYATVISPGGCVGLGSGSCPGAVQDFAGAGIGGAVQGDTGVLAFTGVDAFNNTAFTGDLRELVVTDTVTGNLDFLYMVAGISGDNIARLTNTSFTGFTTDVGYSSTPATDLLALGDTPSIAPDFISSGNGGSNIGFNFSVPAGQETFLLVVKTNATTFGTGSSQLIDGGVATISTLAPTPEPALGGLLLGGLFGAGLFVTRRFRTRPQH